MTILITIVFSAILAFVLGVALGFFQKAFAIERDPKIDEVRAVLPGANCGACGFPGCDGYAEAVALGKAPTTNCRAGGSFTAAAVSKVMGVKASSEDLVAVLRCQGSKDLAADKGTYVGLTNCRAAKIAVGGVKKCAWGCQGFGDSRTRKPSGVSGGERNQLLRGEPSLFWWDSALPRGRRGSSGNPRLPRRGGDGTALPRRVSRGALHDKLCGESLP